MTKKEIKKIKSIAPYIAMGVLLLLVAGGFAVAEYQAAKVVNVAGDYIEAPLPEGFISEELGAISSPDFISDWMRHNGLMTFVRSGTFLDATTTIVSEINPFNSVPTSTLDVRFNNAQYFTATATVDLIQLNITGVATSSAEITCGASVDPYTLPSYDLISLKLTTSTLGIFENNLVATGGFGAITGGTVAKILLTHDYPYFNCVATGGENGDDSGWWETEEARKGFTGDTNTFDGTYKIRIYKNQ